MAFASSDHNASVRVVAASRDLAAALLAELAELGLSVEFVAPADAADDLAGSASRCRVVVVLDTQDAASLGALARRLAVRLPCVLVSDGAYVSDEGFHSVVPAHTTPVELASHVRRLLAQRDVAPPMLGGDSAAISQARWLIERVAANAAPVLLYGEVGTGKSSAAAQIHRLSGGRGALVRVQCATIADDDVETALFGDTGTHPGYLKASAGGTLVLEEVTELAPAFQARLLQLLRTRRCTRPGDARAHVLEARLIATTRWPLRAVMERGRLRPDLYHELAVFPIRLPALRERPGDIETLIDQLCSGTSKATPRFDASALADLQRHAWPGNLHELSNVIERLAILYPGVSINRARLEACLHVECTVATQARADEGGSDSSPAARIAAMTLPENGVDLRSLSERLEKQLIEQALARHGRVVAHAARALGLRRTTLTEKLRRYAIRTD